MSEPPHFQLPEPEAFEVATNSDDTLRRLFAAAADGEPIPVTLYLPWGIAVGLTASHEEFLEQAHYSFNDRPELIEPFQNGDDDDYIYLMNVTTAIDGELSNILRHNVIKIRLDQVVSWAFGQPERSKP